MAFEPLRFVHAANLCLDATLQCTVALPPSAQVRVEDATLIAFENVINACINRKADFLLLTGNSFIERDRSLRARLTLRDGFRRLEKHGIAVFVTPGELDPPEAWRAIPELSSNVTVCYPSNPEPVAVMRDGRVIATIANTVFYGEADEFGIKTAGGNAERRPYRIGMLPHSRLMELDDKSAPTEEESQDNEQFERQLASYMRQALVDYAALTGRQQRQTYQLKSGIAHCPGRTQTLAPGDHGKHAATLVEVEASGEAKCRREHSVAVRWKIFNLDLERLRDSDEIIAFCNAALSEQAREKTDDIWLVSWNLTALGEVVDDFRDETYREYFAAGIEQNRQPEDPEYVHSFRVFSSAGERRNQNELARQFSAMTADLPLNEELLRQVLGDGKETGLAWNDRLKALIPEVDTNMIAAHLRRLGGNWFADERPQVEVETEA